MSEKPLLVRARADSLRVAQGSIFGLRCAVCSGGHGCPFGSGAAGAT
jgi:hypothetical protein